MKALSLWQPWAQAMALDAKRIETRGWGTRYRGPLAIHAAKRKVQIELIDYACDAKWSAALQTELNGNDLEKTLAFGAIVCVVDLVDVRPTETFTVGELDAILGEKPPWQWTERDMGDFRPHRFGWVTENLRTLETPLPWKGSQGLFNVPDELILPRL